MGVLSLIIGFIGGVVGAATVVLRAMLSNKVSTAEEMSHGDWAYGPLAVCLTSGRASGCRCIPLPPITETFRAMWLTMRPQQSQGKHDLGHVERNRRGQDHDCLRHWRSGSPMMASACC